MVVGLLGQNRTEPITYNKVHNIKLNVIIQNTISFSPVLRPYTILSNRIIQKYFIHTYFEQDRKLHSSILHDNY